MVKKNNFNVDISVIIPFYKEIDIIANAIESVQRQTDVEDLTFEIIIGNDSPYSNDQIFEFIPHSSLSITRIATNIGARGAGNARNAAIDVSRGKVIAFLDADDVWQLDKIYDQFGYIRDGCNFIAGAYQFFGSQSVVRPPKSIVSTIDFLRNATIGTSTVLVSRELIGEDRFSNLPSSQDTEFWARLAGKSTFRYGCSQNVCAIYTPSLRTSNKLREFERFKHVVSLFNLNSYEEIVIFIRYMMRGVYNHFIKNKLLPLFFSMRRFFSS